jgi:hypothetical protein
MAPSVIGAKFGIHEGLFLGSLACEGSMHKKKLADASGRLLACAS